MVASKEAGVVDTVEANEYVSLSARGNDLPCGVGFNLIASPETISWRRVSPSKGWKHIVTKEDSKVVERDVPWGVPPSLRVPPSPFVETCRYQGDSRLSQGT